MTTHELTSLFNPKTVAIVGASATPGKIGSRIVENLVNGGYPGTIYPVNPRGGEIAGVEVVRSIADIPEQIDVAYVIVPAAAAVTATRELAQAGARNVIVAASQFGESGTTEGIAHENGLREIARSTGTRIVGPNCNGIYSATHRASIGFNTAHAQVHRTGGVAIVSHSGAVFSTIMGRAAAEGMGLSAFVSVGNECDLDVLDYIAHFVTDPDTRCIALIIDSIPDGARFASLVRQAHDGGKTVIALKLGTTDVGASAAVAHSSRLAGMAEAYLAFLSDLGVSVVRTIEELVSTATLLDHPAPIPAHARIGVATMSGGVGTLVADTAVHLGLEIPPLSEESRRELEELLPSNMVENPIDLGGLYGTLNSAGMFDLLGRDCNIDVVLFFYHAQATSDAAVSLAKTLVQNCERSGKRHVVIAPGRLSAAEYDIYRAGGVTVLHDTESALRGIAAGAAQSEPRSLLAPEAPSAIADLPVDAFGALSEAASIDILRTTGVPMVAYSTVTTAQDAIDAWERAGGPVVLKGVVPGVAHKSDLGLVVVGVDSADEIRGEVARLVQVGSVAVVVQPMVSGRVEALLGIVTEPTLGRFLVVGLGGVFAESLTDTALVSVHSSDDRIREVISRTRLGAVLRSPRWDAQEGFDRFVEGAIALARWSARVDDRLVAVDINPVLISEKSAIGVDGLLVVSEPAQLAGQAPQLQTSGRSAE